MAAGGDTVAAVQRAGIADRLGYLSPCGAAFLKALEGQPLPGVGGLERRRLSIRFGRGVNG